MDFEHSAMVMQQMCNNSDLVRDRQLALIAEQSRPFMLLRPKLFPDGDQWCAIYGENLQEGVAAFGKTPEKASIQFDVEWLNCKSESMEQGHISQTNSI